MLSSVQRFRKALMPSEQEKSILKVFYRPNKFLRPEDEDFKQVFCRQKSM